MTVAEEIRAEEREKERARSRREIALNGLKMGYSPTEMANLTGIPLEEIDILVAETGELP